MKTKRKLKTIRGGGGALQAQGFDIHAFLAGLPNEEQALQESKLQESKEGGIKLLTEINNTNQLKVGDIILYYRPPMTKVIGEVKELPSEKDKPLVVQAEHMDDNYPGDPYRANIYKLSSSFFKLNINSDIGKIIKSYLSRSGTESSRGGRRTKRRRKKRKTRKKRKNLKKRTKKGGNYKWVGYAEFYRYLTRIDRAALNVDPEEVEASTGARYTYRYINNTNHVVTEELAQKEQLNPQEGTYRFSFWRYDDSDILHEFDSSDSHHPPEEEVQFRIPDPNAPQPGGGKKKRRRKTRRKKKNLKKRTKSKK